MEGQGLVSVTVKERLVPLLEMDEKATSCGAFPAPRKLKWIREAFTHKTTPLPERS
jgi:hypothetical protein